MHTKSMVRWERMRRNILAKTLRRFFNDLMNLNFICGISCKGRWMKKKWIINTLNEKKCKWDNEEKLSTIKKEFQSKMKNFLLLRTQERRFRREEYRRIHDFDDIDRYEWRNHQDLVDDSISILDKNNCQSHLWRKQFLRFSWFSSGRNGEKIWSWPSRISFSSWSTIRSSILINCSLNRNIYNSISISSLINDR